MIWSFSMLSTYFSFLYLCLFLFYFYFSLFSISLSISLYFLFLWYLSIPRFLLCLFYFWFIWFLYFNIYSNLYFLLNIFCILFNFNFSACNKEAHWAPGRTEARPRVQCDQKRRNSPIRSLFELKLNGDGIRLWGGEEKEK